MRLLLLWAPLAATAAFADEVPDLTTARHLSGDGALGWFGAALAFLAVCAAVGMRARNSNRKATSA